MLTLLQRLINPFLRCLRQTSPTHAPPQTQQTGNPETTNDDEGGGNPKSPSSNISPSTLPELTDRGTATAHLCGNENVYWNSTLTEGEDGVDSGHVTEGGGSSRSKEQIILSNADPGPSKLRKDTELTFFKELNDHDIGQNPYNDVASNELYQEPKHEYSDEKPTLSSKSLSPPKYRMPSIQQGGSSRGLHREELLQATQPSSNTNLNAFPIEIDLDRWTLARSTSPREVYTTPPNLSYELNTAPTPPNTVTSEHLVNGTSVTSSSNNNGLTWDGALSHILNSGYIDPATIQTIQERTQNSQLVNGTGNAHPASSLTRAAGLVPNFSYPIAGSAFYDRTAAEQPSQHPLTNGINGSNHIDEKLTNGVLPHETLNWPLSDSILEQERHIATPIDEPPDRLRSLLTSELTRSELSLHNHIINTAPSSTNGTVLPPYLATSNTLATMCRVERLIHRQHYLLHGLQDRVNGLEDSLVPQLSTWLEQKTHTIHQMALEIAMLKKIVDSGNEVLGGCWSREEELLLTLVKFRERGKQKERRFRKWRRRKSQYVPDEQSLATGKKDERAEEDADMHGEVGEVPESVQQGRSEQTTSEQRIHLCHSTTARSVLSRRELDVLVDMTKRNVQFLEQNIDEMIARVEEYKKMSGPPRDDPVEEGSWRSV